MKLTYDRAFLQADLMEISKARNPLVKNKGLFDRVRTTDEWVGLYVALFFISQGAQKSHASPGRTKRSIVEQSIN